MNSNEKIKYLKMLGEQFPSRQTVCTEIINLEAILNLPKGTEHFLSDLHGEYEAFFHILKNASGVIKTKIDEIFENSMMEKDKKMLATLVYYPKEKLELLRKEGILTEEFYIVTLSRLIKLCKGVSSKYTRSKVRKAIHKNYEYIVDELLFINQIDINQNTYYKQILNSIIKLDRADSFIIVLSDLIKRLSVDHLHILGDIYDRGPGPHIIMDELMKYHSIDIQWGNHDMLWMGAASGSEACIFNVLRICARYNNLDILEEGYGINIRHITEFALEQYKGMVPDMYKPSNVEEASEKEIITMGKTQQAAAIIQFKLEGQVIRNNPEFEMKDRLVLSKIDYEKMNALMDGKKCILTDNNFPTIDKEDPYKLTEKEQEVVNKLKKAFLNSEKLQKHIQFLYSKGDIYKVYNNNLLIHGCLPMDNKGEFVKCKINGKELYGKSYLDEIQNVVTNGYFAKEGTTEKQYGLDFMWYLWCGKNSPIFCKDTMRTFERYYIADPELKKENKNPFYDFQDNEEVIQKILDEFEINGHVICGHIPVKFKLGESPRKANGKLYIIDGGLSKAYQQTTGIAGYTLTCSSFGITVVAHKPFTSTAEAIEQETDLHSEVQDTQITERKTIRDTDIGRNLLEQIEDLKKLLNAYTTGVIIEEID